MTEKIVADAARDFEKAMARMGADPAVLGECAAIAREFSHADADDLEDADGD